jgi:hypothetical protein
MDVCKICENRQRCDSKFKGDVFICNEFCYIVLRDGKFIKKFPHYGDENELKKWNGVIYEELENDS